MLKLKGTDPCWCGLTGKLYKDCHENRHLQTPIPEGQLRFLENQARNIELCLHPNAGTGVCGGFMNAHTLQKAGPIKKLMDATYEVNTFYGAGRETDGTLKVGRMPWTKASTFRGFCDIHDSSLFTEIENKTFVGTGEQNFLVGYRAVCHELYQKTSVLPVIKVWRGHLDRGEAEAEQMKIQEGINQYEKAVDVGLNEIQTLKAVYDSCFSANDYSQLNYAVIYFDGDLSVASTRAILPDYDVYGMLLQRINYLGRPAEGLIFGTLTTLAGSAFVFSWPTAHKKCSYFVKKMINIGTDLPSYLIEFMFWYVENTFFSQAWWTSLTTKQQERIAELAGFSVPHAGKVKYSREQFTNWAVTNIDQRIT
jgi:hypothetical protein